MRPPLGAGLVSDVRLDDDDVVGEGMLGCGKGIVAVMLCCLGWLGLCLVILCLVKVMR